MAEGIKNILKTFLDKLIWTGTQSEYDALETKSKLRFYLITNKNAKLCIGDEVIKPVVSCTQSEYDALTTKDDDTLYCITEESDSVPYIADYTNYISLSYNSSSSNAFTVTLNSATRVGNVLYITYTAYCGSTAFTAGETGYVNMSVKSGYTDKIAWNTTKWKCADTGSSFYGKYCFTSHWNTDNAGMFKIRIHDAWVVSSGITFAHQIPLTKYEV